MEIPKSKRSQEEITLQMIVELNRLRDALVRLSLATSDWLFEAKMANDPDASTFASSTIEKSKSVDCDRNKS